MFFSSFLFWLTLFCCFSSLHILVPSVPVLSLFVHHDHHLSSLLSLACVYVGSMPPSHASSSDESLSNSNSAAAADAVPDTGGGMPDTGGGMSGTGGGKSGTAGSAPCGRGGRGGPSADDGATVCGDDAAAGAPGERCATEEDRMEGKREYG